MPSAGPWSACEVVPLAAADSREPAIAMIGETLHLVWNYNRMLYHAWCAAGVWSEPTKVAIGEQPVLAATAGGQLQCLFINQFVRNYEIYQVEWNQTAWTLPVNASRTYGVSRQPALAIDTDGRLHAAWADTTPGYSTIYYGTRGSGFWASRPVPSGRGIAPAIAATPDGGIFIAWSDRRSDSGVYDVFCTICRDNIWSPPESVSDSAGNNSLFPKLAVDSGGNCHGIWQEEQDGVYHIFHSQRRAGGWSRQADISQADADCQLAQIAANPAGFVHVAWSDGGALNHRAKSVATDAPWRPAESAARSCFDLTDVASAVSVSRRMHLVWSGLDATDTRRLFHAQRDQYPKFSVFMPIVMG